MTVGCCKEDVRNKIPQEFSWRPCSSGSLGNGASSASGELPAPISRFYLILFDKSPSIHSELCEGTASLPKEALFSGIQAGNLPGWAPWTCPQPEPCFPAVQHAESWKGVVFSSKIDTKTCFKGTSCTHFLSPHPDQSSVSKIPPVEGGNRGNNVSFSHCGRHKSQI